MVPVLVLVNFGGIMKLFGSIGYIFSYFKILELRFSHFLDLTSIQCWISKIRHVSGLALVVVCNSFHMNFV